MALCAAGFTSPAFGPRLSPGWWLTSCHAHRWDPPGFPGRWFRGWEGGWVQMRCRGWVQPVRSPLTSRGVVGTCFTRAWLTRLISRHRRTELRPAGPQTLLPAGRHPLHLRRYRHRPVSESEGGHSGLGDVQRGRVMGRLKWCLPLGAHGQSRDQPSVPIGWVGKVGRRAGRSGTGAHRWRLGGSFDV